MNYKILKIIVPLLIMNTSCTINLLPNQNNVSFFNLDEIDRKLPIESFCVSNKKNQLFLNKVETTPPYNGFRIIVFSANGTLTKLGDQQWITSLDILLTSKLKEIAYSKCKETNSFPFFSADLSTNSNKTLSVTLLDAKVNNLNNQTTAETSISMIVRSEITGEILTSSVSRSIVPISDSTIPEAEAVKRSINAAIIDGLEKIAANTDLLEN